MDRLCRELRAEKESVLIAYKPQGRKDEEYPSLGEDSFLLGIMTQFQATMFEKHSQRVVGIDSTHKTNPYGFKLVTVVVPDKFKNGDKNLFLKSVLDHYVRLLLLQEYQLHGVLLTRKMCQLLRLSLKGFISMSLELLSILL